MIVRASVVAGAALFAGLTLYSMDLRQTYEEMYPADGLKRDAFGICHQSNSTFVRAIRADRVGCYDSMPNSFALAIGWARRGAGLAAVPPQSLGTLETADLLIAGRSFRMQARAETHVLPGSGSSSAPCAAAQYPAEAAAAPHVKLASAEGSLTPPPSNDPLPLLNLAGTDTPTSPTAAGLPSSVPAGLSATSRAAPLELLPAARTAGIVSTPARLAKTVCPSGA